jgi:hypothetical protein
VLICDFIFVNIVTVQLTRGTIHLFKLNNNKTNDNGTTTVNNTNNVSSTTRNELDAALLPPNRTSLVCVPAVPAHISPAHFIEFLGEHVIEVRHIRIVADERDDRYMALLRFATVKDADQFRFARHGRPFSGSGSGCGSSCSSNLCNNADNERASVLYVAKVTTVRRGARLFPHDGACQLSY